MEKLKLYIRQHEQLMRILAVFYNIIMFNLVKGKSGLIINKSGSFLKRCKIKNWGYNNKIVIEEGCRINNCNICIYGNNNIIVFRKDCLFNALDVWCADGSRIDINCNTHITGFTHIAAIEGKTVSVGSRCLFSSNIIIRTGDSHSILDMQNNRINPSKDVIIGEHTWIGQNVTILKGANIGSETVIGSGSIVTAKKYIGNAILGGHPAAILKDNITWHHELL